MQSDISEEWHGKDYSTVPVFLDKTDLQHMQQNIQQGPKDYKAL